MKPDRSGEMQVYYLLLFIYQPYRHLYHTMYETNTKFLFFKAGN